MAGTVFRVKNQIDGITYRVSVIEMRKYIQYVGRNFYGEAEKSTAFITIEAAIGKANSFVSVFFPTFVIGYCSGNPPGLDYEAFCIFIKEVVSSSNISDIRHMNANPVPRELCERAHVMQWTGFRLHLWNRRRLPHLFIIDPNRHQRQ
jgi:hypothetical protein